MNVEIARSLMSIGDVLYIVVIVILLLLKAGEDLGLLFRKQPRHLTIDSATDPNTSIGMIARFNNGPLDSYRWISRNIRDDSERFLVKPIEEIFDANLEILFVATKFFEPKAGETLKFRECFSKIVSSRGKIMDAFGEVIARTGIFSAVRLQRISKKEVKLIVLDIVEDERSLVERTKTFSMKLPLAFDEIKAADAPVQLCLFQDVEPKLRRTFSILQLEDVKLLGALMYSYNDKDNHILKYCRSHCKVISFFQFSNHNSEGISNFSRHFFNMICRIQSHHGLLSSVAGLSAVPDSDQFETYFFEIDETEHAIEEILLMLSSLLKSEFKLSTHPHVFKTTKNTESHYYSRPVIMSTLNYFEKRSHEGKNLKHLRIFSQNDMNGLKIDHNIFGFIQLGPRNIPVFVDHVTEKINLHLDVDCSCLSSLYSALFSSGCENKFWSKHLVELKFERNLGKTSILACFAYMTAEEFKVLESTFWSMLLELLNTVSMEQTLAIGKPVKSLNEFNSDSFEEDASDSEFEEALRNFGSNLPAMPVSWMVSHIINATMSKSTVNELNARSAAILLSELQSLLADSSSWLHSFYLKLEPTKFPLGKPAEQRTFRIKYAIHPIGLFEVLKKSLTDVVTAININDGYRAVVEISISVDVPRNSFVLEVSFYQNASTSILQESLAGIKTK